MLESIFLGIYKKWIINRTYWATAVKITVGKESRRAVNK